MLRAGRGLADRERHAGRGAPRARAAVRRRRARLTDLRHVGQLLHAAATAEQLGATALTVVAAPADRRGRRGHERRGAQPPPGVRRRGGPGPHHPPHQGPRVPDRLLPVPVGAGLDPQRAQPVFFHDPDAGDGRVIDVGMDGPDFPRATAPARGRAARRGPAARLRRADPRPAPGRRVVGRLLGQPQLGARPAAVRARRRRATSPPAGRSTPTDAAARPRASRSSPPRRPGCISVEQATLGLPRAVGRRAARRRPTLSAARFDRELDWRWRRTSYSDITAGAVRGAGGERARGARRRRRGAARRRRRPPPRTRPAVAAARRAVAARGDAGRRARRHLRAPRLRGDRLRRARPRRRAGRRTSPRCRRAGASTSATRHAVVAGLRAAIETPLGPAARRQARCATSSAPIASTSWSSRCRSSAATRPPAGCRSPRSAPSCASTSRATTRSPATRSASRTRSCARACAATSPAASTSSVRADGTASPSPTTRRTGSRPRARS